MDRQLTEKEQIEKATAELFLGLYNLRMNTSFEIIALSDAPDVRCSDKSSGRVLNLEICVLEDVPGDARYRLGRGPKPATGLPGGARCFSSDTIPQLMERLKDKLAKRYGPSTALVVRQLAPIWDTADWERHLPDTDWSLLGYEPHIFPEGIWIVCMKADDALFRHGEMDIHRIDPDRGTEA
jgi:hypothetical protein